MGSVDLYYEFPKKKIQMWIVTMVAWICFWPLKSLAQLRKVRHTNSDLKGGDALPDDPVRSMYWFQISANNHGSRVGVKTLEFVAYLPPDQMDASMDSFRVKIKQGKI